MKREFLQGLQVEGKALSKEIIDAIMAENGKDIQAARQLGSQWEEKYNRAVQSHAQQLGALRLQNALDSAITRAGGRNAKAITALLDLESIQDSQDLSGDLDAALQQLKQEEGYLFQSPQAPPYAAGTGTHSPIQQPATLAGALRERAQKQ